MGTDFVYDFKSSGRRMKPEDLSAEVLKSLRSDVLARRDEDIQAAVITIPAAFELHQCEATKRAGQLAGFRSSPLLQEPVAAALAYGFQADAEKSFWMVFDFGGGTFDAALIKAEDGIINVVNHGGDNFLGGSDLDWSIVEKLVIPRLVDSHHLPAFRRGNKRWEVAMRKLKRAVENARIELSRSPNSALEDCLFADADGNDIEVELTLTAADVARVAEPIVRKSVEIFQKVLSEKKLSVSALSRVILVGGPTKAPYFRDQLRHELGIDLDLSIDPMTAVAQGAAVFAGTQRLDPKVFRAAPAVGEFTLDLDYKPVSHENDPLVAGRATAEGFTDFAGYTIEFVNKGSQWRSGKIPLKADGAFMASLLAEKGARNTFIIEIISPSGSKQNAAPDQLVYTMGATVEAQTLGKAIGLALENNTVDWFFEKGASLPQRKRGKDSYLSTKAVSSGSNAEAFVIPIVEGEHEAADRNRIIGKLQVRGTDIKRDLPVGTEIEITIRIEESRLLRLDAYIPTLDQDFPCELDLSKKQNLTSQDLNTRWKHQQERVRSFARKADEAEDRDTQRELQSIISSELAAEIKAEIAAAPTDPDACEKADKRLLEFALQVDAIEIRLAWPASVAEAQEYMNDLEKAASKHGTSEQQRKAAALNTDLEVCIQAKDSERLERKRREISSLYSEIVTNQDGFWVNQLLYLESVRCKFSDSVKSGQLITQGRAYLANNNPAGVRNTVRELWSLLPREVAEGLQRGVRSTVVRG